LKRPILIAIDDVDRLTAAEIRILIQLIKANSDFPNLAFLILCQRDIVEQSLAESLPSKLGAETKAGGQFLQKIVHVGLTLPELLPNQIEPQLRQALSDAVGERFPIESEELNQTVQMILPYFGTMRHLIRFSSTIRFQIGMFTTE